MAEIYIQNGTIRLHAIGVGDADPRRVPLLIVPGLAESADDYLDVVEYL
jgi:hypothetical protein